MGSEWTYTSIDELQADSKGSIAIGPFGSRMKSDCYVESGIPVIRGTNITGGPNFEGEFVYITEEKADTLGSSNVYQGDLVFPHRGAIGEVGILQEDRRFVLSSSLMKLTCDEQKAHPKFLYYFFKSHLGKHELLKNASQVGTPGIGQPLTSLKSIELSLPPLPEQKAIAHILGTLDDKIELNRRMNATLEGMAQALFKSWFVDFDPVIDNALAAGNPIPDELAPRAEVRKKVHQAEARQAGSMGMALANDTTQQGSVDHPTLSDPKSLFPAAFQFDDALGWIPEGWEVKSLRDCSVEVESGKRPKGGVDKSLSDGVPSVGAESLLKIGEFAFSKLKYVTKDFAEKASKGWVQNYDVAIYKDGANVGDPTRVSMFGNGFPFEDFMVNEHVFLVRSSAIGQPFLYSLFKSEGLSRQLHSMGTSKAAQPGLNQKEVLSCAFVFSSDELCDAFNKRVYPLIGRRLQQGKESQTLTRLRDTLLPKLISGELRLSKVEQLTKEDNPEIE